MLSKESVRRIRRGGLPDEECLQSEKEKMPHEKQAEGVV